MRRLGAAAAMMLFGCTLFACGGDPKAPAIPAGPAHDKISTAADRTDVGITVYTDDFGLVRESRNLSIGEGRVSLEVRDVASSIQPETVAIRSAAGKGALRVLEQNYRYDLLEPQKLLEKYVGKDVHVIRYNKESGKDETFAATVASRQRRGQAKSRDHIFDGKNRMGGGLRAHRRRYRHERGSHRLGHAA